MMDEARCVERVHVNVGFGRFAQCSRKRGHGPNGLYCKQHSPESAKARDEKQRAAFEEESRLQAERAENRLVGTYLRRVDPDKFAVLLKASRP